MQKGTPWTLNVVGSGQSDHDVAAWIDGLKQLPWAQDIWVSNTSKQGDSQTVQSDSQATLAPPGASDRLAQREADGAS